MRHGVVAAALLLAPILLGVPLQPGDLVDGKVELIPVEDAKTFQLAVRVAKGVDADQAVVTIHYKADVPQLGELWLTKTSVVDVIPDVAVMADGVPVPRERVQRIEVTLVKNVESHTFQMAEKK
jgi:hypothetical protein